MQTYEFTGGLKFYKFKSDGMGGGFTVLYLEPSLVSQLPFDKYPRVRIEGSIDGEYIEGTFMPSGDKRYFLLLNKKLLKKINKRVGDVVEIIFSVADQDYVNEPDNLINSLKLKGYFDKWMTLTPGKRRSFSYSYFKAKTEKTRNKRFLEVVDYIDSLKYDK